MKLSSPLAILAITAATGVSATTHVVKAVAQPSFQFQPNVVKAEVGDYIEFHFGPKNHSVAQGSFSSACVPTHDRGFFSGYFPVEEGESDKVFKVLIENEDPFVFYCTQGSHCATGMFGIVNPNDKYNGESYAALVSGLTDKKAVEPMDGPFGGAVINNPSLTKPGTEDQPTTTTATGGSSGGSFTTILGSDSPEPTDDGASDTEGGDAGTVPGSSIETDGAGSAGVAVGAPVAGLTAALGVAVLLA